MNNKNSIYDNENIDFSKLKLIGYYKSDSTHMHPESVHVIEAQELSTLLGATISAPESMATLDDVLRHDIEKAVLILKNYSGHLFAYLHTTGLARITDVRYNRNTITFMPAEYKHYFTPGEPLMAVQPEETQALSTKPKGLTKVILDNLGIVRKDDFLHFKVIYGGQFCFVRLLPFQVSLYDHYANKKQIACVYLGLDENGAPHLVQDRDDLVDELYEGDTVQTFTYLKTEVDYKAQEGTEYHLVRDAYGLKHRLYAHLSDEQKVIGTQLDLYVRGINAKNKTLVLSIYRPELDRMEKNWYSADRVFGEIGENVNKELYFDCYINENQKNITKLQHDLIGQYNGKSNLWLFSYMNLLDSHIIGSCISQHHIEDLANICQIMIKLQEWMVEGSTFLDLFGDETKDTTITKSSCQIQKYHRLLLAIDVVRSGNQNKYIGDIVTSIHKSGRIAIRREERVEVMINILRIYPEYFSQDLGATCELIHALLSLDEGISHFEMGFITNRLTHYIETNVRKMRASAIRSNEIDTSQTLLIKEVLAMLCMKIMIHTSEKYSNELEARASKARFFRLLSFICADDMKSTMLKAGIDSLVGVMDSSNIFTWNHAANINTIELCNLTANAPVLDCNTENDFYYMKSVGKTGIVRLDSTGFTIVPYKQCITNFKKNSEFMNEIKVIHHLETLPIKLGTMHTIAPLTMEHDAVKQFILWRAIAKHPEDLIENVDLPNPQVGNRVRVCVKEQAQSDKLKYMIFVSVIDPRFNSVEGVLMPKGISGKWIADARKLFNEGEVFYAEVIDITDNGKYQFSIRKDVDRYATAKSSVDEDVRCIVVNSQVISDLSMLPSTFIQELILLIDLSIRREDDQMKKLTLIGYAYCLSALASDPKSYYYDFLLRYYASIDKFLSNEHQDVEISFHDTIDSHFSTIVKKRRLIELLSYASNQDAKGLQTLRVLAEDNPGSDTAKLASTLMAYIYATKAELSNITIDCIKDEISHYVDDSDKLDLVTLSSESTDKSEGIEICDEETHVEPESNSSPNETMHDKTVTENQTTQEAPNTLSSPKDLRLYILNNNSIVVDEYSQTSKQINAAMEIIIPAYANNGIVILANNDGGVCKLASQDFAHIPLGERIDSNLNPYKISNYFVIPNDCIFGSILFSGTEKYVKLYRTTDMPACNYIQPTFIKEDKIEVLRHQPFILPSDCDINGLTAYLGRCVTCREIPEQIVEQLISYNVFI